MDNPRNPMTLEQTKNGIVTSREDKDRTMQKIRKDSLRRRMMMHHGTSSTLSSAVTGSTTKSMRTWNTTGKKTHPIISRRSLSLAVDRCSARDLQATRNNTEFSLSARELQTELKKAGIDLNAFDETGLCHASPPPTPSRTATTGSGASWQRSHRRRRQENNINHGNKKSDDASTYKGQNDKADNFHVRPLPRRASSFETNSTNDGEVVPPSPAVTLAHGPIERSSPLDSGTASVSTWTYQSSQEEKPTYSLQEETTVDEISDMRQQSQQNSMAGPMTSSQKDGLDDIDISLRLETSELRSRIYQQKLENSEDLMSSLLRDLERARRSIHSMVSRNLALTSHMTIMKRDQEENFVHRSTLFKACVYVSPVFIFCGGFEVFLSTIVLVWLLVEIESTAAAAATAAEEEEEENDEGDFTSDDDNDESNSSGNDTARDIIDGSLKIPENILLLSTPCTD